MKNITLSVDEDILKQLKVKLVESDLSISKWFELMAKKDIHPLLKVDPLSIPGVKRGAKVFGPSSSIVTSTSEAIQEPSLVPDDSMTKREE